MAKYTIRIKEICENYYRSKHLEPPEKTTSKPVKIGEWLNDFNTNYKTPYSEERQEYPKPTELIDLIVKDKVIFNFDYELYDKEHKTELEKKILMHYYMYEIGSETIPLFQLKLEEKLKLILPFYNKLYETETWNLENPLVNHDLTDHSERETDRKGTSVTNGTTNGNSTDTTIFENTPSSKLGDVDYATTRTTEKNNNEGTSNTNGNTTNNTNDTYDRHVYGLSNYSKQDMIRRYRENLLNIDYQIIDELSDLFMLIYE